MANAKTKTIEMLRTIRVVPGFAGRKGQIKEDVPSDLAERLIKKGSARLVTASETKKTTADK